MKEFNKIRNKAAKSQFDPRNIEFGKRLKELLKKRGITQCDACKMMDISKTMIYRWTSGQKMMRVNTLAQFVDTLSFTTSELGYLFEVYFKEEDDG